jgi:FtsH-binding integral membrane protein
MKNMNRMNSHQVKFNPVVNSIKMNDNLEKEEDVKSNLQSENKKMLTMNSIKSNNLRLNSNNSDGKNDVYIYTNHSQNNESPSKKNLDNNHSGKLSKRNSTKTKRTTKENFEISELQKKIRVKFIRKIYIVFLIHIIITFGLCFLCYLSKIEDFITSQKILLIIIGGVAVVLIIVIECFLEASKKIPMNYLLFIGWMIFELYLLLALCCFCNKKYSLSSIGILVGSSIGLLIYSLIITMDYGYFGGMISCCIFDLISFGIFGLCFGK